ncbi:MAG: hypothetical protein AMJ46_14265 [Latescibacteria bacterium DG_63]|nr:MAG: hypothetical protein AMJ46_14265 [Latescibacteria bacterium DG_63]
MSVRERYEKALTEVRRLIQEERKEKARKEVGEILKELEQIDQAALQRGLAEQREGRAEVAWEDLDGVRLGTHNDHPPGRVGTQAKKVG